MKRGMCMVAAVAAMVLGGASAVRAATTYDADVTVPPGVFFGSGNPNGGYTVESDNGIEIGLRAKYRFNANVIDSASNVYNVVPGPQTLATTGGGHAADANRAAWNYEFSVNLNPTNSAGGYLTLDQVTAMLTVTDVNTGTTNTVDALRYFTDDAGYGPAGVHGGNAGWQSGDWAAQNSENATFTGITGFPLAGIGGYTFDMNAPHTYLFTLEVKNGSSVLASDTIQVNVVPLPASAWGGMALLGMMGGFAGLKRLRTAKA
jgi:hypothetical protein